MNPKIQKLRDERAKHKSKISALQERVRDLDKQIRELENIEIIGLVRERGLSLEQFAALLAGTQNAPAPELEPDTYGEGDGGDAQT